MPQPNIYEALDFLCKNIGLGSQTGGVKIHDEETNTKRMGDCEKQIDNIIKALGLHADQHPEKDLEHKSITPLRICPGGRLNSRE